MLGLEYKKNSLLFDQKSIEKILKDHPTPFYLYSENIIVKQFTTFLLAAKGQEIENPLICFALKANPNAALISSLFKKGAGADIAVSYTHLTLPTTPYV